MGIREIQEQVRFAGLFNEALWSIVFEIPVADTPTKRQPYPYYHILSKYKLSRKFQGDLQPSFERALSILVAQHLCEKLSADQLQLFLPAFNSMTVVGTLIKNASKEPDLRYLYMRSLRERYGLHLNSKTAEAFSLFADTTNQVLEAERKLGRQEERRGGIALELRKALLAPLKEAWISRGLEAGSVESELNVFIETCRVVNYFQPHHHPGKVLINPRQIDSEYLLSNLFGLSTSMPGFDDLFGGGGIMLTDSLGDLNETNVDGGKVPTDSFKEPNESSIDGRKVLVVGRYGSGKSLLSLQMGVEVARKGGAVWVMSLEQPAKECLYALAAVGQYPNRQSVRIEINPVDAAIALEEEAERGLLLFVDNTKDTYELFLKSLRQNAALLSKHAAKYPLRLIIIDPINAVFRKRDTIAELRDETLRSLDEVAKDNTNVWIVSEDEGEKELSFAFEQNIADTVIKLHNTRSHDYSIRFIEVAKSRMQRELRGWHALSIKPEGGILVVPAPAAVAARIRHRSTLRTGQYVEFGVPGMEDVLTHSGLAAGDVTIIRGPEGNMKTQLGQSFLFTADLPVEQISKRAKIKSLLVSAGEDADKIRGDLEQTLDRLPSNVRRKNLDDILILSIPKGYIQPGFVLQLVERLLTNSRQQRFLIDRVTVDDVRSWVLSCPFLREDATFGDTLVELFRKYGVTSCFVCSEATTDHNSVLRDMIISNADCEIQLLSHNFRGAARSIIQVAKTREMSHRRELFELNVDNSKFSVKPISSLLRVDKDGDIKPVTIQLFLYAETLGQQHYNHHIQGAIQSTLSPETYLADQSRVFLSAATNLGRSAAVDELHLVQLDEFQMPAISGTGDNSIQLRRYSDALWPEESWGGLLEVLETRVRRKGSAFIGMPFFCNIGVLAYKHDVVSADVVKDWTLLAQECNSWQQRNKEPGLFFDFPAGANENYNCLFWEILLASIDCQRLRADNCVLIQILTSGEAVEAALIMRCLARRAHLQKQVGENQDDLSLRARMSTSINALVWRHWYTTLNDMLASLEEKTRRDIAVALLPKEVCVAGEWYVAIPQYSAAPENGLELIRMLTSREAELDRMIRGVGLPTRAAFYYGDKERPASGVLSPFFRLKKNEVGDRISTAFRRSRFQCYSLLSPVLATHLKQILEIPDCPAEELRSEVGSVLASLVDTLRFVERSGTGFLCMSCGSRRSNVNPTEHS
jgi:KaiC/GvpD/RAD55 family RecA-like ATPase